MDELARRREQKAPDPSKVDFDWMLERYQVMKAQRMQYENTFLSDATEVEEETVTVTQSSGDLEIIEEDDE